MLRVGIALLVFVTLAGCGGGGGVVTPPVDPPTPPPTFTSPFVGHWMQGSRDITIDADGRIGGAWNFVPVAAFCDNTGHITGSITGNVTPSTGAFGRKLLTGTINSESVSLMLQ